jgi:hypothetical protein
MQINPTITPLQNRHQIPNHIIFYTHNTAIVADLQYTEVFRRPIHFIRRTPYHYNTFDLKDYIGTPLLHFFQIYLCKGKLYALVRDILYTIDLFTVTEILQIPGELNPGFYRCCVVNDKIVVTNEKQFFFYDEINIRFTEIVIKIDNAPILF